MEIDLEKIIKDSDSSIEKIPLKDFSEQAYLNYSMYDNTNNSRRKNRRKKE